MSYRDLLAEAQARKNAEARAIKAEAKLARIGELCDETHPPFDLEQIGTGKWVPATYVLAILSES